MCEGFEDYPTGAPGNGSGWKPVGTNGEVTVDTTRAMSGKNALHVTGTQKQCGGCGASIFKPLAVPAKTVFVRYMMYTVSYPASQGVHTRVITMGTSRENGYSLATYNGTAVEKVNAVLMRDTSTNLNAPAVKNRWVCWEFSVDATGGVGKVAPAIWLDGKQLSLSKAGSASHGGTTDSWDPIPYEMFYVGFWGWQADPVPADFWIDDLVVHSERLNCPAAN